MRAGGRGWTSLKAQGALCGQPCCLPGVPAWPGSSRIPPCIQCMSFTKSGAPGRAGHGPYSSPRVYAKHLDGKRINFVKYLRDSWHNERHPVERGSILSPSVFSLLFYFVICNSFQRIKERPHATLNGPTGYEMYPDLRNVTCEKMWGLESRKYGLPPRAPFCTSGFEAELRGSAEAVKDLGHRQSATSLCFGYKRWGQKRRQNEMAWRCLLDCLRAKTKGRKLAVNNVNWIEVATHN